ncbi:MAG: Methyltransferase, cyclopropane fatty acid synthase [Deltaproteobacteria bacterium]|nr:Methyltransferase, cyclopropane fatty acid synthase [Deltaproteobacteria bacterium]
MSHKKMIEALLEGTGIKINGSNPCDIQVHDNRFYKRVLTNSSLGLGESYMDGWWDSKSLDGFFFKIFSSGIENKARNWQIIPYLLRNVITSVGHKSKAFNIGEKHYDIGNDLYKNMLDKRMVYTCGYWKEARNLDEAQEAKLDLVCRKLDFNRGQKVLDIGCGWGSFAKYAAEKYGVSVTGVTVSKEQAELGRETCKGLPVEIRLQDYRDLSGQFDHIVSLGMFEHVGYKYYRTYMKIVNSCLKDHGLFLLHTIGGNRSVVATDPWIDKHIFPDSMLPSIKQIGSSIENLFVMEDWHNFGSDYDRTLMAWYSNFNKSWDDIKSDYDDRFYRMWKYYLLSCAGSFRARKNQLWQVVLSKNGVFGGYNFR